MKITRTFAAVLAVAVLLASCAEPPRDTAPDPTNSPTPEILASTAAETASVDPTSVPETLPTEAPTRAPTQTIEPTIVTIPTATEEIPPTAILTPVDPDWSGEWEVFIANPRISIVKPIEFILPTGDDNILRAEWYEGTRFVYLDAVLSEDGRTITGTFWNTDIDALDVVLTLSPDGTYFTGTADSDVGPGQFCGTRLGGSRPSPCRGEGN